MECRKATINEPVNDISPEELTFMEKIELMTYYGEIMNTPTSR